MFLAKSNQLKKFISENAKKLDFVDKDDKKVDGDKLKE